MQAVGRQQVDFQPRVFGENEVALVGSREIGRRRVRDNRRLVRSHHVIVRAAHGAARGTRLSCGAIIGRMLRTAKRTEFERILNRDHKLRLALEDGS